MRLTKDLSDLQTKSSNNLVVNQFIRLVEKDSLVLGEHNFYRAALRIDQPNNARAKLKPLFSLLFNLRFPVRRRNNLDCKIRGSNTVAPGRNSSTMLTDECDIRCQNGIGIAFQFEPNFRTVHRS